MIRLFLSITALFALAGQVQALELSLEECTELALRNNRRLMARDAGLQVASEEVRIARSDFLPTLSMSGRYSILDQPERVRIDSDLLGPGIPAEDVDVTDTRSLYAVTLTLTQPLFTGGRLSHALDKADLRTEQARLELSRQRRLVVFEVTRTYFGALNASLETKTIEKRIALAREGLNVTEAYFAEGNAQKEDMLARKYALTLQELALLRSRNRAGNMLDRLKSLLHCDPKEELSLLPPDSYHTLPEALPVDFEADLAGSREDLRALEKRIEAVGEEVAITRSEFFPELALEGEYTEQKETSQADPQVWMVGGTIEWRLFEGGKTRAKLRKQQAQRRKLEHSREALARDIHVEIKEAWRAAKEKEKLLEALGEEVRLAESRMRAGAARYAEGRARLLGILERETELAAAYNEYLSGISDLKIDQARLELALPRPLGDLLQPRPTLDLDLEALAVKRRTPDSHPLPPKTDELSRPAAEKESEGVSSAGFAIQVGAFRKKGNAERLKESLLGKAQESTIIIRQVKGLYKVRLSGFESFSAASKALARLDRKGLVVKSAGSD